MNPNYIIPQLTKEQKDIARRILQKESGATALALLAEPPPNGIGLQISKATFFRLKQRLELEAQLAELGDIRPQAAAIAAEKPLEDLDIASRVLLKEKAFQLVLSNDPFGIDLSCRILRNLQRLEQAAASRPDPSRVSEEVRLHVAALMLRFQPHFDLIQAQSSLSFDEKAHLLSHKLLELWEAL